MRSTVLVAGLLIAPTVSWCVSGSGPQSAALTPEIDSRRVGDVPVEVDGGPFEESLTERARSVVVSDYALAPPRPKTIEGERATLQLEIHDRETGERVEGPVRLWRLDVPRNASRTRGDQLVYTWFATRLRTTIRDLIPGRYRLEVGARSPFDDDPPEFVVTAPVTRRRLAVRSPEELSARLILYDERGNPVREAWFFPGRTRWAPVRDRLPDWVVRREPIGPSRSNDLRGANDGPRERRAFAPTEHVRAGPLGFELGPFPRYSDAYRVTELVHVRGPGGRRVLCEVDVARTTERVYVGVLVDEKAIREHLVFPDGCTAAEVPAGTIDVRAIPLADTRTAWPWREVPIHVCASEGGYGYDEIRFTFCLNDGPPEDRYFIPDTVTTTDERMRIVETARELRAAARR